MKATRYIILVVFVCGLVLAACEKEPALENDATTRSAGADSDSIKKGGITITVDTTWLGEYYYGF